MLPLELVDTIFRYLYDSEGTPTLQACSLVCHQFLSISQRYLRRVMVITEDNVAAQAAAITPQIARHVQELYIESTGLSGRDDSNDGPDYGPDSEDPNDDDPDDGTDDDTDDNRDYEDPDDEPDENPDNWLLSLADDLELCLKQSFPQLQKFALVFCAFADWTSMRPELQANILRLTQCHSLRYLRLFGLNNLPLTLIGSLKFIQHLEIGDITLSPQAEVIQAHSTELRQQLRTLRLSVQRDEQGPDNSKQWFEMQNGIARVLDLLLDPASPFDMTVLVGASIRVELDNRMRRGLEELISHCSGSLRELKIFSGAFLCIPGTDALDLKHLYALEHLLIYMHFECSEIKWITQTLKLLTSSNYLKEVTLVLQRYALMYPLDWPALDAQLERMLKTTLQKLRIICWKMTGCSCEKASCDTCTEGVFFEGLVRGALSSSWETGLISIESITYSPYDHFTVCGWDADHLQKQDRLWRSGKRWGKGISEK